jgi:hypothetical protein
LVLVQLVSDHRPDPPENAAHRPALSAGVPTAQFVNAPNAGAPFEYSVVPLTFVPDVQRHTPLTP